MEKIQAINGERLLWCCAENRITLNQLAKEVGVATKTLTDVTEKDGGLTFNQLSKIASYFGRGVLFFLEQDEIKVDDVYTPAFRTLANQKPELSPRIRALIARVERQRDVFRNLREELSGLNDEFPIFRPPQLPLGDIARAAAIAREWLGLGDQNTFDSYRAAVESRGILVFRSNGHNGKWQIAKESPILGFSLYDDDCPVIVVKKMPSEARQVFTLMHELGHLLLHRASSIDDETDMRATEGQEREANAFAGHLLVPVSMLQLVEDGQRPADVSEFENWLRPVTSQLGVSAEVVLRRLLDVGRLTQVSYQSYRKWRDDVVVPVVEGGSRKYRHREPKHIFGDRFVRTVLDALSNHYISLSKASDYLDGLKVHDLHELERHYARV